MSAQQFGKDGLFPAAQKGLEQIRIAPALVRSKK
jgi:hypothetical protein